MAALYGVAWWRCILYFFATAAAYSLPYSPDRLSYPVIFLVGMTYGATPLIVKFKKSWLWWPLLTGATLAGLLFLSAQAAWWTHKWTESIVFAEAGFLLAYAIDRRDR